MKPQPDAGGAIPRLPLLDRLKARIAELKAEGARHVESWCADGAGHQYGPEVECVACDDIFGQAALLADADAALRSCQQELNQAVVEGDMARRERNRFEAELADVRADRDRLHRELVAAAYLVLDRAERFRRATHAITSALKPEDRYLIEGLDQLRAALVGDDPRPA